jgi:hypothetical protein|nr:MAG TPA: TRAF PROTEIN, TRAO PROTEIN, TRAN ADHESION, BACTERIAL SECRETION.5A [Caudoviricetes sp.]
MKKIVIALSLLMLGCKGFCADMVQPEQTFEDNRAVITVQKQPTDNQSTQKQNIKNNWFCVVVQVNGKVVDTSLPIKK